MSVASDRFESDRPASPRWGPAGSSGSSSAARAGTARRPGRGRLSASLLAWFDACALDRRLADGASPDQSAVLAARARRVTSRRNRKRLAAGLDRVLNSARGARPGFTAAIAPNGREAEAARTVLIALQRRLREAAPVAPQGAAMLMVLLTDGSSPLYRPAAPGTLGSSLRAAAAALEPAAQARGGSDRLTAPTGTEQVR